MPNPKAPCPCTDPLGPVPPYNTYPERGPEIIGDREKCSGRSPLRPSVRSRSQGLWGPSLIQDKSWNKWNTDHRPRKSEDMYCSPRGPTTVPNSIMSAMIRCWSTWPLMQQSQNSLSEAQSLTPVHPVTATTAIEGWSKWLPHTISREIPSTPYALNLRASEI